MLDSYMRPLIDPPLNRIGKQLAQRGISSDSVTISGFVMGLVAIFLITQESYLLALGFICLNRLLDGIDGAIARHSGLRDFGGFLDIVCDFIFYAGVIFAFGVADHTRLLSASFLIFSFIGPMSSFLAYAILAAKNNRNTTSRGKKSFYYLGGICEGTETFVVFIILCFSPDYFDLIAYSFAALCWLTTMGRIFMAKAHFNTNLPSYDAYDTAYKGLEEGTKTRVQ